MNRSSVRLRLPENKEVAIISKYEKAAATDGKLATQLDVCRCPKCDGPMTARSSRHGSYFHCLCAERAKICQKGLVTSAAACFELADKSLISCGQAAL